MPKVALAGPARPQAADGADGDRDRARRRDGHRHVRPHRLDQGRLRRDLHRDLPRHRRDRHRQVRVRPLRPVEHARAPPFDRVAARARCARCPTSHDAVGGVGGIAHLVGHERQGDRLRRRAAPRLQRRPGRDPQFNTLTLVDGDWPGADELVVDKATAGKKDLEVGQTIGVEANGPVRQMRISGLVKFGGASSLGGATLAGFDLPTAQPLFDKRGQARPDPRAGEAGRRRPSSSRPRSRRSCRRTRRCGPARRRRPRTRPTRRASSRFLQNFLLAFGGIALFVGAS